MKSCDATAPDRRSDDGPSLARLLRPRHVAVFGGTAAAEVIRQSERIGFTGEIWPVHPRRDEIAGRPTYRSVDDLPAAPDAAFIGVNPQATIDVAAALAAKGAGGAVCYASGFAEIGAEGVVLQARLHAAAGEMPFFGPNCHGFINYLDGVALWPEQHGGTRVERGVALVTQSGNIGLNLTMQARGLPLACLITLGNQAGIGLSGAIAALLEDGRITAIGLHIEGIDDPVAFAAAALRARALGVPIVALKSGRSVESVRAALSHTASLAGADRVADAFLHRLGVGRVPSAPALLECLKLLHFQGPLRGRDIASMSCSGGEAGLIADTALSHGLRFRPLTEAQAALVAATLPRVATASNPLDYHNFTWGDEAALTATFTAMMAASFDFTLLVLDFPRLDRCSDRGFDTTLASLKEAAAYSGGRAGIVATLQESLPEARAAALGRAGIVPFAGLDEALAALAAAADIGTTADAAPPLVSRTAPAGAIVPMSEWAAKRRLAAHGVPVPEGFFVRSSDEAVDAAAALGGQVAVKAVGSAIAHKTEIGAVRLGLAGAAVAEAARDLLALGDGLLVERFVPDAVAELIVGVARDPAIGLHLVLGSGGILVELVGDSRVLLMPASEAAIRSVILDLKAAKLIQGHRGRPAGDLDAAVAAVVAVQDFALAHGDRLVELDINPLLVRPAGGGAVAADALIRMTEGGNDD